MHADLAVNQTRVTLMFTEEVAKSVWEENGIWVNLHGPIVVLPHTMQDNTPPDLNKHPAIEGPVGTSIWPAPKLMIDHMGSDARAYLHRAVAKDCVLFTSKYADAMPQLPHDKIVLVAGWRHDGKAEQRRAPRGQGEALESDRVEPSRAGQPGGRAPPRRPAPRPLVRQPAAAGGARGLRRQPCPPSAPPLLLAQHAAAVEPGRFDQVTTGGVRETELDIALDNAFLDRQL
mmetsp:Transcript_111190/g.314640  ORF Transcript_111190/g.314640 Transcript_111190/m.314640 type:complete len:231 (+) Transcript_111190:555-1247(+)